jgi:hypothetical protein
VTAASAGAIGVDTARARLVPAPPRLWWMYLLVVFALAAAGAGAGQAVLVAYNLARFTTVDTCLAMHGISPAALLQSAPSFQDVSQFTACSATVRQQQAVAMLIGAVAVPLAAWLLLVGGGLEMRRRLRRGRIEAAPSPAARAATERFEAWCDTWHLSGRRRPRLVLAAPGTGNVEAFTTSLPFTRPLIVIPLAYAYGEPAGFDVVTLHELAHVRSRDLVWASLVWWTGWVSVLALLSALGPFLADPGRLSNQNNESLALAFLISTTVLLLRAALLRRRELAADRHAVDVLDDQDALLRALRHDPGAVAGPGAPTGPGTGFRLARTVRRAFASHPAIATRAAADPASADRWEGGFAVSATAGLVAMYTYQIISVVLVDLVGPASPDSRITDMAYVAAALLWAAIVVPAWARRTQNAGRSGAAPSWPGPLGGAVAGLLAGYFLEIPGATPPGISVLYPGDVPVIVAGMLIVGAGAGTLAAALVCGFPDRLRNRHRLAALAGAVLAVSTALAAAWILLSDLVQAQKNWGSGAMIRLFLTSFTLDGYWRFATLVLLTGLAPAAWAAKAPQEPGSVGPMPVRTRRWIAASAVLVGGTAATLSEELRYAPSMSEDQTYLLRDQRYWICAAAGCVVVAAILLGRSQARAPSAGRRDFKSLGNLPSALIAGLLAAGLSGVAQWTAIGLWSHGMHMQLLVESVEEPPWLVLEATLVISPWLILGAGLADRIRRPAAAASESTDVIGNPARHTTLRAVLSTGAIVAIAAAALAGGVLSPLTGEPDDYSGQVAASRLSQAQSDPAVPTPAPAPAFTTKAAPPPGGPDPGRPLDHAAVLKVLAGIPPLLPTGLKLIANTPPPILTTKPAACGKLLADDNAAENALPETADATETYTLPARGAYEGIITMTLGMASFTGPAPDFTTLHNEAVACRQYTTPYPHSDGGLSHGSFSDSKLTSLLYSGYEVFTQTAAHVRSAPVVSLGLTEIVNVGHNAVEIDFAYTYWGTPSPSSTRQYCEQLAATALNTAIRQLQTG